MKNVFLLATLLSTAQLCAIDPFGFIKEASHTTYNTINIDITQQQNSDELNNLNPKQTTKETTKKDSANVKKYLVALFLLRSIWIPF